MRLAAIADIHFTRSSQGTFLDLFQNAAAAADVLLLCGDLTDFGLCEEAELLATDLRAVVDTPILAVLGNHDYESGQQEEIKKTLTTAKIIVLDGDAVEIDGVGFAGAKGFAGGFGRRALEPWGEPIIKAFVQEAVAEAMKLEVALSRLRTERRCVLLHYAPIQGTVEGEPLEILSYLGSSRLEEPLVKYPPDLIIHGHAHRGSPEGVTAAGTPVYNVSMSLLSRQSPHRMPFRLLDL
jgi:Icc-related predicted phosphoesterase